MMEQHRDLIEAAKAALTLLEEWQLTIEWEFGDCRSLEEMEEAGDLRPEIIELRKVLSEVKTDE
jgi:hypothetical protein